MALWKHQPVRGFSAEPKEERIEAFATSLGHSWSVIFGGTQGSINSDFPTNWQGFTQPLETFAR